MIDRIRSYVGVHPRRSLALLFGLLIAVLVVVWLVRYMDSGSLTIYTNSSNSTIVLSKSGEGSVTATAQGRLRARVKAGDYVASVSTRTSSSKIAVRITPRHSVEYNVVLH